MRIDLHIGVEQCGAARVQGILARQRDALSKQGIRYADSPGNKNHTRLWMAITDPLHVDPLRFHRGFSSAEAQARLLEEVRSGLEQEIATHTPRVLILSASQLCWLAARSELERLRDLLSAFSQDIRIIAHVDEQSRVLSRVYADQIMNGRATSLDQELSLAARPDWWGSVLKFAPDITPASAQFIETQSAPFWLDYQKLVAHWGAVFGADNVALHGYDPALFDSRRIAMHISDVFALDDAVQAVQKTTPFAPLAAPWLTRARLLNEVLITLVSNGTYTIPRPLWRSLLEEVEIDGHALDPGALHPVSDRFTQDNAALLGAHPGLQTTTFTPPTPSERWSEPDPTNGYRATQYLLSFKWRLDKAQKKPKDAAPQAEDELSETAKALMPPMAVQNFKKLRGGPFAPHNRLGAVDEEQLAAAFSPTPHRTLPKGSSGNVIVGCMKNEAPYIVEWVAYHRAIGVDNFLIYTNGCEDGTSEMLDHLQSMGVLQHRLNDDWKGNSPQQFALDRSLEEPVIRHADWVIHIDVDEFMNIRCGNGTLDDLFARVPDATNIAMTWRLFGHNDVTTLCDDLVIDQFDTCAPKFCPKPHTVWGFKTMFKNIGAYGKISCHRPNKLVEGMENRVKWVNGSGKDMTREAVKNGWRNSKKSIGYDLIQLNHYALRSAESFLVKRQRGRALHVDRSIGLNYWIRMDWTASRDITIKRNIPRVRAEYDRLMQDPTLRKFHQDGLAWHRNKAQELKQVPEFQELYEQALKVKLTEMERVAYALALDMES